MAARRRGRFYGAKLTGAERACLVEAREMEGIAEEIAVLRVKLRTAIDEHPNDMRLLSLGMEALVRAVSAEYRLSPKSRRDLAESFTNLLNSLGDQLLPVGR